MGNCCVTTDKELISKILNHPKVYKWITDDCSPKVYEPVIQHNVIYLTNETQSGIVRIDPMNGICCQAHIALLPEMNGNGKEFVISAMTWGFSKTKYMKVVAFISENNRLAIKLVKDCGFNEEGRLKKSRLKNWKMYDQIIYGITKSEFYSGG